MLATKVKGEITKDRKLVLSLPNEIAPGLVEVIILHEKTAKSVKKRIRRKSHPAFGMWAGRKDVNSSAEFAATLRQQVEERTNGRR